MTTLELCLVVMATTRISNIWLYEAIARPARQWFGTPEGILGYGANCLLCVSVWFSAVFVSLMWWGGTPGRFVVTFLSVSQGMLILELLAARVRR